MQAKKFFSLSKSENWFMAIDVEIRICIALFIAFLSVVIDSPRSLLLLFYFLFGIHLSLKIEKEKLFILTSMVFLNLWGFIFTQALFYSKMPRTPVQCLLSPDFFLLGYLTDGIYVYAEGIIYGAIQGLRTSVMLLMGLLICWNVAHSELLLLLKRWGVHRKMIFMLATALHFFPSIAHEVDLVWQAYVIKGCKTKGNLLQRLKLSKQMLMPVIAKSIRRSSILALSIEGRGFSRSSAGSETGVTRKVAVLLFIIFIILICIMVVFLKVMLYGFTRGLLYVDILHDYYYLIEMWL